MRKPLIVVFEGQDKVGKSTLVKKFNEATNFKYLVIDRLTTSSFVYTEAFGRGDDVMAYFNEVHETFKKNFTVLQVLLVSDEDDIIKRLNDAGEKLPKELADIKKVKEKFFKFSLDSGFELVTIDTSAKSIDEAVRDVVAKVDYILRRLSR